MARLNVYPGQLRKYKTRNGNYSFILVIEVKQNLLPWHPNVLCLYDNGLTDYVFLEDALKWEIVT